MKITVNDKMQHDYTYTTTAPVGRGFAVGFDPYFSPKEMLELGVFEGCYLNDCKGEFPEGWYKKAKIADRPDINCNYFNIKSRQGLSVWREKGWIIGPDVRGWFQWYCRYYMGRRLNEVDALQIKRWRGFKRHLAQIEKNCPVMDLSCRKKQRQALLQWSYNPFI